MVVSQGLVQEADSVPFDAKQRDLGIPRARGGVAFV